MAEYKHFAYWMPSKKASENSMKFHSECIVNIPVEKNAGQTFLELYTLPGGKNRIRKLLSNIPYINDILSVLDRVSSVKMQNRLIISYNIAGGLLNVFNDGVKEGYKCIEMLVNLIERNGVKPSKILVTRDETYYLYVDICKQLDITFEVVDHLEFARQVRYGMSNFMMR